MSLIDADVRASWCAWSKPFEGRVPTMYRDSDAEGWVTVGVGCLIDPEPLARTLPWRKHGDELATPDEIYSEWWRVKRLPAAMAWWRYAGPMALHLDDAAIDDLVLQRLDADAVVLAAFWPAFGDFPAGAQRGLLSLAWGVGPGATGSGLTGPTWPHLHAAVEAQDWRAAAEAGQLGPAYGARNAATRAAFLDAANEAAA